MLVQSNITVHTFDQLILRTANDHNLVNIVLLFVYKLRYSVKWSNELCRDHWSGLTKFINK